MPALTEEERAAAVATNREKCAWVGEVVDEFRAEFGIDQVRVTAVFSASGELLLGKAPPVERFVPPTAAERRVCLLRGCFTRSYCDRHNHRCDPARL